MWKPSGNLIIAGHTFQIDAPVINWMEGPMWDATSEYCRPTMTDPNPPCTIDPKTGKHIPYGKLPLGPYTQRYSTRPALRQYGGGFHAPLDAVKSVIKQFVIHHDGCNTSDMCFSVLQNERGLSVHFLLDNDGTIYQTIDLALMAYHASEWNTASIGVEMCCRGDALKEPHYYDSGRWGPKRDIVPCRINNNVISSFEYTKEQYESLTKLSRALVRLLPNLPAEYPQSSPGQQSWDTLPYASTFTFSGYIGHYHLWNQKWDPGPFDFKKFCHSLRGQLCFPLPPREPKDKAPNPPQIPQQTDDLKDATKDLYKLNEQKADGGFFPVGPWGDARLWHGGVHLAVKEEGEPVYAPFPGRLVAARMGTKTPIGSVNFVLLKHDMSLGATKVQFYSLYMHLHDETGADGSPAWMQGATWKKDGKPGAVVLLDEPVEAGSVIGHVGRAGPDNLSRAQVHVEFFSTAELFTDLPGSPWTVVDGTAGGRFCDAPEINNAIDTDHDGTLSKQELANFYAGGGASSLYYLITLHVSEWTAEPAWSDALRVPKDFKKLPAAEIDQLVADQITPGLWWTDEVAAHCRLPVDGVVYHYHPVSFLQYFNQSLLDAAANAGPGTIDPALAQEIPKGITDDLADKDGTSMRSSSDESGDPCNSKLTLEQLVEGFDTPECAP